MPFPFSAAQYANVLLLTLPRVPDPNGVYSSVPAHYLASALPLSVRFISVDDGGSAVQVNANRATSACRRRVSVPRAAVRHLAQPQSLRPVEVQPSHDGVSNTVLLCGQMRILAPVERNLTLRSGVRVCG